ncbi:45144_t:CDS:2 [Gigaspora margarita]|uniref:45144_t:CDS:1 n=1 Tax=Gigaspora margarita TaxID=4874 RepID=A0ABN7W8T9_GIGMA|nr:45144_t:CDS:2 [Gigaspora margarita]
MKKLFLHDACAIAKSHGGECLSIEYKNTITPLKWRCSKNHTWTALLKKVKYDKLWCPHCASTKLTLEDAIQITLSKHGQCLSTEYVNNKIPMLWKCYQNHIWSVSFSNIKNLGTWCPYCTGMPFQLKYSIYNACKIAKSRGGQCLSDNYINCNTPLRWKCAKGHEWAAHFHNIKNGKTWCPYCAGNVRFTIKVAKQIAFDRNGKCLSENTWCPYCNNKYMRENLCRKIISKYLGLPSENRKPDFLKTPEHPVGLELDIPYYDYSFAIEVQGEQHEKYNEFFHKGDPNNFVRQQKRDQLKKELCEDNWIVLRYLWYYENLYIVIPEHLRELGLIE